MNKNNIILKKHGRLIRHLWREVYGGCGLENDIDDNELTIECPNGMGYIDLVLSDAGQYMGIHRFDTGGKEDYEPVMAEVEIQASINNDMKVTLREILMYLQKVKIDEAFKDELMCAETTEVIQTYQHPKIGILIGRVEKIGDSKTRCIVNFGGVFLPIAFPTNIIKHHNLKEDDTFRWDRRHARDIKVDDIEPYEVELPVITEEEMEDFINNGTPFSEILDKFEKKDKEQ